MLHFLRLTSLILILNSFSLFRILKTNTIKVIYNILTTTAIEKVIIPFIVNNVANLRFVQVNKEMHTILIKYKAIVYFQIKK